jgi:hypothetical protein
MSSSVLLRAGGDPVCHLFHSYCASFFFFLCFCFGADGSDQSVLPDWVMPIRFHWAKVCELNSPFVWGIWCFYGVDCANVSLISIRMGVLCAAAVDWILSHERVFCLDVVKAAVSQVLPVCSTKMHLSPVGNPTQYARSVRWPLCGQKISWERTIPGNRLMPTSIRCVHETYKIHHYNSVFFF